MDLDYKEIGKRIARRRRQLKLRQAEVEEKADIGYKYLSNIERGLSVPLHRGDHAPGRRPGHHPGRVPGGNRTAGGGGVEERGPAAADHG